MDDRTGADSVRTGRRRRAAVLAGLMLAAGALTACGLGGSGASAGASTGVGEVPSASAVPSGSAGSSPGPSASPTAAPSASATAEPTSPGIAPGEPAPTPVKIPATGYRLDSPTTITVFFAAGICDKYGLKVEEDTPPVLKVRVVITQTAPRGQVCPALVTTQEVHATLSHPKTSGPVIDLATGEQLSPNVTVPAGGPR